MSDEGIFYCLLQPTLLILITQGIGGALWSAGRLQEKGKSIRLRLMKSWKTQPRPADRNAPLTPEASGVKK
ncbi:MAG TPA: hypothetical protein PLQ57_11485 [Saprospiraceae bacterium]|nr:hypothetical protein [Saprospiraceae bacterium]